MIYLNNAATSYPKPESIVNAVLKNMCRLPSEQGRSTMERTSVIDKCRAQVAALIHANTPEEIYFTSGATESANLAIAGLELLGGHVVTTTTEHNSILRPLYNHKAHPEVTCIRCDRTGYVEPSAIEKAIRPNTKAIFVNHCSNVTGMVQNIKAIGAVAKKRGVLFAVDAAQSLGCIPVNVDEAKIDILIFTGHKSLFGISGTGGLYIRRGTPLHPVKLGGTGHDSHLVRLPKNYGVFECGTPNMVGICALSEGLTFLENTGYENVYKHIWNMTEKLIEALSKMPDIEMYCSNQGIKKGPVVSFNIRGINASDVGYMLTNIYDIVLRTGLHCCPLIHEDIHSGRFGTVRASLSYFTSEQDIRTFVSAIGEICESRNIRPGV